MPKNKTHSGAKKRFRVTGSGKLMREQTRLSKDQTVAAADVRQAKKLLGL